MEILNYSSKLTERTSISWGISFNKIETWEIRSFCKIYDINVYWKDLEMEGYKIDYMKDPLCERSTTTKTDPKRDDGSWMVYG